MNAIPRYGHADVDDVGESMLQAAADASAVVRLLIQYGADVNHVDNDGYTALYSAVIFRYEDKVEIVRLLVEAGADVNYRKPRAHSMLKYATSRNPLILCLLLRAGADYTERDSDNRSLEEYVGAKLALIEIEGTTNVENTANLEMSERILKAVRRAGSWKKMVLAPHHRMLAHRALFLRGRAEVTPSTAPVVARLFSELLPEPLFYIVLEYWLGDSAWLPDTATGPPRYDVERALSTEHAHHEYLEAYRKWQTSDEAGCFRY